MHVTLILSLEFLGQNGCLNTKTGLKPLNPLYFSKRNITHEQRTKIYFISHSLEKWLLGGKAEKKKRD